MKPDGTRAERQLIADLCHQINSPLAAIRNALYLSGARSHDPDLLRYLTLANAEISSIAAILREARVILGDLPQPEPRRPDNRNGHRQSRRAAA